MTRVKTTPQNVAEANEALFRATMNLPAAAAHCGMTHKEMKLTFWEYLKYNAPDYEITEDSPSLPRRQVQSTLKTPPVRPRPEGV
jgi:hypothetical protein